MKHCSMPQEETSIKQKEMVSDKGTTDGVFLMGLINI